MLPKKAIRFHGGVSFWCWHQLHKFITIVICIRSLHNDKTDDLLFQAIKMQNRLVNVWSWYFNFTQVGGLSQARSEDNKFFKILWFLGYAFGILLTIGTVLFLFRDYERYEIRTRIGIQSQPLLNLPSVTICNSNKVHCGNLYKLVDGCETVSYF